MKEQKRCCTICDAKKVCHVCGDQTLWACSDCQINLAATVYVCGKRECRNHHDRVCSARAERAEARIGELERWNAELTRTHNSYVVMNSRLEDRAERAEAECKALRALLTRWLECMGNFAPPRLKRLIEDTRAALNPSPEAPKED